MARSISTRIYRTVFAACFISLSAAAFVVIVGYEDLEQSMLELDFKAERDFIIEHADPQTPLLWNTGHLLAAYLPKTLPSQQPPELFRKFPFPFSGEVEIDGKTFLITMNQSDSGRFYLAKDISLFEEREVMFQQLLGATGVGALLLSLLISHIIARQLAAPLQRLATTIRSTPPGQRMPRLELDFRDTELQAIGEGFNAFLDELEGFVKREQLLLSLASHELRTPIAVISGALEVLQQRNQLSASDQKTLQRIHNATAEMKTNVEALLKLSRRRGTAESASALSLALVLQQVLADLASAGHNPQRVQLELVAQPIVTTDPTLVTMLLRNLIQNALQHTQESITVRLEANTVTVIDRGNGLPESALRLLHMAFLSNREIPKLTGLGLYIVTLICQRLDWGIEVDSSDTGSSVRLRFKSESV